MMKYDTVRIVIERLKVSLRDELLGSNGIKVGTSVECEADEDMTFMIYPMGDPPPSGSADR